MLARGVKRHGAEIRSIDRDYRYDVSARDGLSGSNAQQGIGAAQAVEGMRFLPADAAEFSVAELTPHVMGPVAVVIQVAHQRGGDAGQRELLVVRAHQTQNRRSD